MAEARAYHYQDNSGLLVGTYGAGVRQPIGRLTIDAKALADYVRIDSRQMFDPSAAVAGPRAPDAVTSASATVGGGQVARKWRYEGLAGLTYQGVVPSRPSWIGALVRGSQEPDYTSLAAAVRAGAELFERNTTVTLQVGFGRDQVKPVEAPAGHLDEWPASHERWAAVASLAQLLSPTLVFTAGVGGTRQRGTLASPYRRAIVNTLLLPEVVPNARDRATGSLGLSWFAAEGAALHLRQGGYVDSWGVRALIPEATLAVEPEPGVLLSATYRYYRQTAASFYEVVYPEVRAEMTGDLRLGAIEDHTLRLDLRWKPGGGSAPLLGRLQTMPILAGYTVSILDYLDPGTRVVAHVFSLGLEAVY